jgi:hypothetical protein
VGQLCRELQGKLLTFEAMLAKTAVRRLLCISQALGIATTSLATKLDIMITEEADQALVARTAQSMVKGGFLVCFQGLISTIGKEHVSGRPVTLLSGVCRDPSPHLTSPPLPVLFSASYVKTHQGMLEDVAVAMELASLFQFELRGKCQLAHTRSPTPIPSPTTAGAGTDGGGLDGLEEDMLQAFGSSPRRPPPTPVAASGKAESAAPASQGPPLLGLELEFDETQKRIRLLLEPAALDRLPPPFKQAMAAASNGALAVPLVALLFCQGIDVKQSIANFSNQLKGKDGGGEDGGAAAAIIGPSIGSAGGGSGGVVAAGTGQGSKKVGGDSTIQPIINRRSLKVLNDFCHRCHPVPDPAPGAPPAAFDRFAERFESSRAATTYGSAEEFARSVDDIPAMHPMLSALRDALKRDNGSHKNMELLREQERAVLELGGGQVRREVEDRLEGGEEREFYFIISWPHALPNHPLTQVIFCKSGKDRTGMGVTLHQARLLGDRHGSGNSPERLARDANAMRLHGVRLLICDKNVGHLKYAFNKLQLQFLPSELRPPSETVFELLDSFMNRDRT